MDEQQRLCVGAGIIYEEEADLGEGELICASTHGGMYGMCGCGREMCARGVHFHSQFVLCFTRLCFDERKAKERDNSNEHARI